MKGKIRGRRKAPLRDSFSFKALERFFFKEWRQINIPNYTKLLTLPNNSRKPYSLTLQQELFKQRRRIETTFSQMTEQLHAQRVLAKTFSGLSLQLLNKFLAFNLCMLLAQSTNIKSLIF